ncbi:class I SAM-dependent methyltransferase [Patescibacteria group bacterium]
MFLPNETNEELKQSIRSWWHKNPFIYDKHRGAEKNQEPVLDWAFFRNTDQKVIKWMSPWAHTGYPLLSNLVDYQALRGKKVLDIAVGTGWTTEQFCRAGADVTAIDLTPRAVEITKRRLALNNLYANVIEGDQENLQFPDESFDYVMAWGCLMHSPNTQKAINEIHRVLKPGGKTGAMMYNKNSLHWKYFIWFGKGILRLKLLKYNEQELSNRYTDGYKVGGNMLTKFYTPDEVAKMYEKFSHKKVNVCDGDGMMDFFPHRKLPLGKLLPLQTKRNCCKKWGQTLWIEAIK